MEKFGLIVLILDQHSQLLDVSQQSFVNFKEQYALVNATLVVIFLGKMTSRIISGQLVSDIDTLPIFDDSAGRNDAVVAIKSWVYEAQANMYSGSTVKLRTGIFVDASDNLINVHLIEPAEILGNLEETEYFQINRQTFSYEPMKISKIAKLEASAKTGDEKALYELGLAYATGEDVKKDELKAQMLLYKAYLRGNIDAVFALVDLFDEPDEHFRKEAAKHR